MKHLSASALSALAALACLGASNCKTVETTRIHAVQGRVANVIKTPSTDERIIVEYSSDSFATLLGRITLNNEQGLLSRAFRIDLPNGPSGLPDRLQLRAFADENGNETYDAGEAYGRFDRTDDGNAPFVTIDLIVSETVKADGATFNLFSPTPDRLDNNLVHGVDISLDALEGP